MDLRTSLQVINRDNISDIEKFLAYVLDASTQELKEAQKRTLAIVYHRLWWYRDQEIKRFFPKTEKFQEYVPFVFSDHKLTAEQDLKNLLLNNKDRFGNPDYPALLKLFKSDISETLSFFTSKENRTVEGTQLILRYNNYGKFWHGDITKSCYPINSKSKRFKLLRYLIENEGFQDTKDILASVGGKDTHSIRTAVKEMRLLIEKKLDLDDVILSNPPDGYALNPKYKVVFEK